MVRYNISVYLYSDASVDVGLHKYPIPNSLHSCHANRIEFLSVGSDAESQTILIVCRRFDVGLSNIYLATSCGVRIIYPLNKRSIKLA